MILIIDNSNNMIFYEKIIKYLYKEYKLKVIFLTFSKRKKDYLDSKNIQAIYLKDINVEDSDIENKINKIENSVENFVFNQCFQNDRILKNFSYKKSQKILLDYSEKFFNVLEKYQVKLVFGEISWGVEYLFYNICKSKNINYIDPLNIYASSDLRLTFFDAQHSDRYMNTISNKQIEVNTNDIIEDRKNSDINDKLGNKLRNLGQRVWIDKINFLIRYRDPYDYRYHSSLKKDTIKTKVYKQFINLFQSFIYSNEKIENQKYYYMPLHIQPEATPDIVSLYYNDQVNIIKQVSKSLPHQTKLIVKEHPNGVGSRSMFELLKIAKIPNVILVRHTKSSKKLIENSLAVITIAGTAAIEARYLHKPVIVFSEIYFATKLTHIYKCYDYNNLPSLLKKFKTEMNFKETKLNEFIEWTYGASFDCYIYDPFIDPNILSDVNIQKFSKAISEYYAK